MSGIVVHSVSLRLAKLNDGNSPQSVDQAQKSSIPHSFYYFYLRDDPTGAVGDVVPGPSRQLECCYWLLQ